LQKNISRGILLLLPIFMCFNWKVLAQQPLFKTLPSAQTNIHFNNAISENETLNVLSYEYFYNGGGVAVGDINNDGLEDLLFTANMQPNKLYLNQGNLKFKDITKEAQVVGKPALPWPMLMAMVYSIFTFAIPVKLVQICAETSFLSTKAIPNL
jgi:hypothetical protein